MAGNYVALNCGDYFVILAHLRRGSISVATDDRVDVGDVLGKWATPDTAQSRTCTCMPREGFPRTPLGGEPLWLTINGRFLVRNERVY